MERALHTLRECPEFAIGGFEPLDTKERSVVALRYEAPSGVMLALTNLADEPCVIDLADQLGDLPEPPTEVFGDGDYGDQPTRPVQAGAQRLRLPVDPPGPVDRGGMRP